MVSRAQALGRLLFVPVLLLAPPAAEGSNAGAVELPAVALMDGKAPPALDGRGAAQLAIEVLHLLPRHPLRDQHVADVQEAADAPAFDDAGAACSVPRESETTLDVAPIGPGPGCDLETGGVGRGWAAPLPAPCHSSISVPMAPRKIT